MLKLYAHQQKVVDENRKKALICHATGTGKTITTLALGYKNSEHILIICPKALKEKWKRDAENFLAEYSKQELTAYGRSVFHLPLILSKEEFKAAHLKLSGYPAVIVDEAHFFSGMKSGMHKALLKYLKIHATKYIWLATATPYLSTPWNIYALAALLGHKWSYMDFKKRFFEDRWLYNRTIPVIKKGIEPEIASIVASLGSVVKLEDCVDVPDQIFETEYFKLNAEQLAAKEDVKKVETNPVVKFTKYHQIENGTLKGNEFVENRFIPCDKSERIFQLAAQTKKIAIFCRYTLQIEFLRTYLATVGKKILVIQGDVKDRDAVVQDAEKQDEVIVLINASCSEGYELPSIGVILYASLSFSFKDYLQSQGRFLRINKLKKNVYIHLVTEGSIDEAVYQSIMRKEDFSLAIYNQESDGVQEKIGIQDELESVSSHTLPFGPGNGGVPE